MSVSDRVRAIVDPLLSQRDLELFDVEQSGSTLRITVDGVGGVSLDTLGELSKDISRALDQLDPLPGRYMLEVSSPGVERNLRTPTHFARAIGETVAVRTHPGVEPRRLRGSLLAADDDGVTLRDEDSDAEVRLSFRDIERVRTVFDWGGPAAKPGKTSPKPKTSTKPKTKASR